MYMQYFLLLITAGLIGLVSGYLSGMLGIGGGSIRIPLLNLIGIPLLAAFGINLFTIPLSSLIGTLSHKEDLDVKNGSYLAIGGVIGVVLGISIAYNLSISPVILAIVFMLTSLLTIIGLNLYKFAPTFSSKFDPSLFRILSSGIVINTITGMRGGSGGSLFPPLLKTFKLDIRRAIATSLFATFFTSIIGVIFFWYKEEILWIEGISVLIGALIGVRFGSIRSIKVKPRRLELLLSILVLIFSFIPIMKIILL
ncbi:MAG: sulfite exporter TauE/SafE family protein [Candidatus Kariarchaeaceae archaeon]